MISRFILVLVFINTFYFILSQSDYEQYYQKAREDYYEARYDDALSNINYYLIRKKTVEGYYMQALIYEAMHKELSAIGALTSLLEVDDEYLEAFFKRGELLYNQRLYLQAIDDFSKIINHDADKETQAIFFKIDPEGQEQVKIGTLVTMQAQVYSLRGLCNQALGLYEEAIIDFNNAIMNDSSGQNFVNRGLLYVEIEDIDLAKQDFHCATLINPNLQIAWFNLLLLYPDIKIPDNVLSENTFAPMIIYQGVDEFQNENYDKARVLFDKALLLKPRDPLLLKNVGRLEYKFGNYERARGFYKIVLDVAPTEFDAYYLIANSYYKENKFEEAAAFYERFLVHDQSNSQIWYNAALTHFELNSIETGCNYLSRAISRGMEIDQGTSLMSKCNQR